MYAIRKRRTNSYLKLQTDHEDNFSSLVFADHCVELNYYVNSSLGLIGSVLKQEGKAETDYCPIFDSSVDPQELEVYDLLNNRVVPLEYVFDGYVDKTISSLEDSYLGDDEIVVVNEK